MTATVGPGRSNGVRRRTTWYAVSPASAWGATSTGSTPAGSLTTDRSGTTTSSAKPPSTVSPVNWWRSQCMSFPRRQAMQRPQLWGGYRITASPGATVETPSPTASTQPAFSWPRTRGIVTPAGSINPSIVCRSVAQTPAPPMRTSTSVTPVGSGSGRSTSSSGRRYSRRRAALTPDPRAAARGLVFDQHSPRTAQPNDRRCAMATMLTPGLSEQEHALALEAFRAALGPDAVLTAEDEPREFRDPFAFATWDDYGASAVLMPQTVEEIQAIVRIANEHKVPLWTHGAGMNNGYGGPAPRLSGSVIVSLRRMNRVLEIDEECAYAIVEPGVRWFDLYDAIRAGGHKLMASVPDLGWGSVVGNTLENGVTYLPTGADMAASCGLEVVLPSGEVMRTGMGAMPGNRAWHVYKRSLGPSPDHLFMQSNLGIVTKLGYWLMPYPECYLPLWLRVWNEDDLAPLVETLRRLMLDRTIENVPQIWNTISFASVLSSRSLWYDGEDPIPDPVIDRIARELEVGRWMMRFALYGDESVVDHRFAKVKEAFERIPGAEVWGEKGSPDYIPALENPHERVQGGVPNLDINQMTGWYGGEEGGHIGFSPVARLTGRDARALRDLIRGLVEREAGLDYAAVLIPTNARSFIHITLVIFDTKNEAEARRAYETCKLLVREAAKEGYGEYRAHLDFMDLAADQYSFGDHAYRRFVETLKDALDPNGILSPGKQGIWPRALRRQRGSAAG